MRAFVLCAVMIGSSLTAQADARQPWREQAAVSLAIRAGVGLLVIGGGALALPAFDDTQDSSSAAVGIGFLMVLVGIGGVAAAVTIDAAMLTFEELEPTPTTTWRVLPCFDLERGRGGASLVWSL